MLSPILVAIYCVAIPVTFIMMFLARPEGRIFRSKHIAIIVNDKHVEITPAKLLNPERKLVLAGGRVRVFRDVKVWAPVRKIVYFCGQYQDPYIDSDTISQIIKGQVLRALLTEKVPVRATPVIIALICGLIIGAYIMFMLVKFGIIHL
ncbi:MAG: hypothetical protein DRJ40_07330 [Thermoprotei archaeon]|nr:MAG: hypothetical protein DRJ40_07330 [Thermoprotei archaeon]